MQKENHIALLHDEVMQSIARFLSVLWMEGEFRFRPDYLVEIFENILKTEIGNDQDLRIKMLAKALESFSDSQIEKACIGIKEA